jgi:hypothetical protein
MQWAMIGCVAWRIWIHDLLCCVPHMDIGLLTVYIRIQLQLDLQADKSPIVVKGPFFPQV